LRGLTQIIKRQEIEREQMLELKKPQFRHSGESPRPEAVY
jgi:hypothetical protein